MTIVISSTDTYEDCWNPFFTLLQKFTDNIDAVKVYLITDNIKYTGHGFVTTLTASNGGEILSWSDRMRNALEQIKEESFLLLLDDYFLRSPLDLESLGRIAKIIDKNDDIGCVSLVSFKNRSNKNKVDFVEQRDKFSSYRICLQPAQWDKSYLKDLLISGESPWQFELLGSLRSNFIDKKVFAITSEWIAENGLIYDTIGTGGIVKGKWLKKEYGKIEKLLGYEISSSRGFLSDEMQMGRLKRKYKLFRDVIFDRVVIVRNIKFLFMNLLN